MATGRVRGKTGGANGKGGNNARKCLICEVLIDLFFPHLMHCNCKEEKKQ